MKNQLLIVISTFIGITMILQNNLVEEGTVINSYNEYENSVSKPLVDLEISEERDFFEWGSQLLNLEADGDSRYNEINPNEVFLEINFIPKHINPDDTESLYEKINEGKKLKGLTLLGRSTCFGCHTDKSNMTGPSFSEIASLYSNNTANVKKLVNSILNGSAGVWGEAEMPVNPGLSQEEASDIVESILWQGAQENNRIFPGLEGVIRIMDKPSNTDKGTYILTASYTSSAQKRGIDQRILNLK